MTVEWSAPDYEEIRRLGAGATGRVVLARHRLTGGLCAVKYLSPQLAADPAYIERFRGEAALLSSIRDPHVVRLYDFVETPGGAALVMEAVDGPTLRILLAQGPRTPEAALAVLRGSLLGLAAAHGLGVVHRDYKPENVLVDAAGESKLADFGVAAPVGGDVGATGTPAYMAPEQWNGWPAAPASDMYAASAVFYETLTGARPYQSETLAGLRQMHESAPVPLDEVPTVLRPLLERGLAKYPQERPADARVFLGELENAAVAGYGADWLERGARDLAVVAVVMIAAFPLLAAAAGGGAAAAGAAGAGAAGAAGASAAGVSAAGAGAAGAAGAGVAGGGAAGVGGAGAAGGAAGAGAGAAHGAVAAAGQGAAQVASQGVVQAAAQSAAQSAAQGVAQGAAQGSAQAAAQGVGQASGQAAGHVAGQGAQAAVQGVGQGSAQAAAHGVGQGAAHGVGQGAAHGVGQGAAHGAAQAAGHGLGETAHQIGTTGRRAARLGRHGAKLMGTKGAIVAVSVVAVAGAGTAIAVTNAGSGTASAASDQSAVASREAQALQFVSKNDIGNLCPMFSDAFLEPVGGVAGCKTLGGFAGIFAGDQTSTDVKGITCDPGKISINGDHATVPLAALLKNGKPIAASDPVADEVGPLTWVRQRGQWVIDPGLPTGLETPSAGPAATVAPTTDAPTTDAPTTDAPTADTPTTTTDAPTPQAANVPDACSLFTSDEIAALTGWSGSVANPTADKAGCNWRIDTRGGTVVSIGFEAVTRARFDYIVSGTGMAVVPDLGDAAYRGGDATDVYWHGMFIDVTIYAQVPGDDTAPQQDALARAIIAKT